MHDNVIELKKKRGVYLVPKGFRPIDPLDAFATMGVGKSRAAKKVARRKGVKLILFGKPMMGKSSYVGVPRWISINPDEDKIGGTI